jgi:hypothetical protein
VKARYTDYLWELYSACQEPLVDFYVADPTLNWLNTMVPPYTDLTAWGAKLEMPTACRSLRDNDIGDLPVSFLMRLYRTFGVSFMKNMWPALSRRPAAANRYDAVDNWVLAASEAANRNLAVFFSDTWRWPVSAAARAEAVTRWGAGKTTIP